LCLSVCGVCGVQSLRLSSLGCVQRNICRTVWPVGQECVTTKMSEGYREWDSLVYVVILKVIFG
jgi:hypothetical protein